MCDTCSWENYLEEIEEIVEDERYEFASDTLRGIHEWVESNEHITEGQMIAISNIRESKE